MEELEKFRIIEATTEHVIVNREPMNLDELNMMRQAVMDQLCREVLEKNTMGVIFPGDEKEEGIKSVCMTSHGRTKTIRRKPSFSPCRR